MSSAPPATARLEVRAGRSGQALVFEYRISAPADADIYIMDNWLQFDAFSGASNVQPAVSVSFEAGSACVLVGIPPCPLSPAPNPPNAFAGPGTSTNQDFADATPAGKPVFDGNGNPINDASGTQMTGTGKGTDVDVSYNPKDWPAKAYKSDAPGDTVLFHEMTHGDHMQQGTYDGSPRADNFDTNEEKNTIDPENIYRDERGVKRRADHHGL